MNNWDEVLRWIIEKIEMDGDDFRVLWVYGVRWISWRSLSRFKRRNSQATQVFSYHTVRIVGIDFVNPALVQLQDPLCEHFVLANPLDLLTGWKAVLQQLPSGRAWEGASIDFTATHTLCNCCNSVVAAMSFWFASPSPFGSVDVGLYRLWLLLMQKGFFRWKRTCLVKVIASPD